jgi:adenylate cyclase
MKPGASDSRLRHILTVGREYLTHWAIAGAIIALTGFAPEHWVADLFSHLAFPAGLRDGWLLRTFDFRLGLVAIGVAIIAWDVLRRSRFQKLSAPLDSQQETLGLVRTPDKSADDQQLIKTTKVATLGLMREGPSIAVLPFTNMSADPEQDYFADGVVEDIITALARYPRLFVVARNSSFSYKGKTVDIRQVSRDLGVRYILEGSVRKAANHVRITGQLIEAETGRHVWAEKYDGELADIFDLQDRITGRVVGTLEPHIQQAEIELSLKKRPDDLTSYDLFLRAKHNFNFVTGEGLDQAVVLAEQALSIDPNFAAAAVLASRARAYRVASGRRLEIDEDLEQSVQLAKKALQLDPVDVDVLSNAGRIFAWTGTDYEGGLELADKAISTYPYSAYAWGEAGWVNMHCAKPTETLRCLERAIELSPRDPFEFDRLAVKSWALIQLGEFDRAIAVARQSIQINKNFSAAHRAFSAALALSGRIPEAQQAGRELLAIEPNFTISRYDRRTRWVAASKTNLIKGLRLAGLPE